MRMVWNTIELIGLVLLGVASAWGADIPACPAPDGVEIRSPPETPMSDLIASLRPN